MQKFGLLVTTEQVSKAALLNVPVLDTSDARLTAKEAVSLIKEDPLRVIGALEDFEQGKTTDDVVKMLFFLIVILDKAEKRHAKDTLVLVMHPERAILLSLPEDEATALVLGSDRDDA
ncbi:MAG: hypothetical protein LDL44_20485 [Caenispirillum sp.]|nr:hypothetical protein [Caenispirillum sp.]